MYIKFETVHFGGLLKGKKRQEGSHVNNFHIRASCILTCLNGLNIF